MDWSNETSLNFIQAYGNHPCLWDPTHPQRTNRFRRIEAWHAIKKELGDLCKLDELRKKKESLMASYRLCKSKVMKSEANAKYEPSWFAYSAMDAFLGWVYETCPTPSMKTENSGYDTANSDCSYQEEPNPYSAARDTKKEPNDTQNNTDEKHSTEHCSQTKMNWSNENIIKFLKLYRRNSCLWDPSHPDNALVRCRTRAWNAIKKELGAPCTIEELKKKKEILIGTYRRFKRKELKSTSTDSQPDWFAFSLIDSFLAPIYKCPRAFILRIENKDNTAYSSSDDEDLKSKLKQLKSESLLELRAERTNRDLLNNENQAHNDSEDEHRLTAQCTETQIDWPSENALRFLKLFRRYPCLWDPTNRRRKNKRYRNKAWLAIKKQLGDLYTVEELKKKKEILMCTYRRCKKNTAKWKSTDCVYRPSWFAFSVMDGFLGSVSKCPEASMRTENKVSTTDSSSEDDGDINNFENDAQNDTEDKQLVITRPRRTESQINWTKEIILQFIELFQSLPCLWDPMYPDYANRRRRTQAWITIKKKLGDRFTINELRRRKDMLLCTYRRCKKNAVEMESKNCVYEPTWFAFSVMDSFLDSIDKCPVAFMRTEDEDHYTANVCYNNEDIQRNQNMYSSLPLRSEDPLELVTEIVNSDLNNYETYAHNETENEKRLAAHCSETEIDWSNENVYKFIEVFQKYPCLWDPTNHERTDEQCIAEAWHAIKKELGDRCTVEELKKKMDSLLAMYRRCKKKLIETASNPSWFAFSVIDGFLGSIYVCQDTQKPQEDKQPYTAESSYYQEEYDSNANSESEEVKKDENYVLIVTPSEHQSKNPLELPTELDDNVVNAQNDTEDEQSVTADCTQTPLNWSNDDSLKFIALYKGHPCLWDPTNPLRRCKQNLANAWRAIKKDMGDRCTVDQLKRKKESLFTRYRSCKKKVIQSEYSFKPFWFAYSAMDDFLGSIYPSSASSNTKSRDHNNTADSSYCQDDSNDSNADSEPNIKKENYVSIVSTSALKRRNPLELSIEKVGRELKKSKSEEQTDEDDECSLFGKLVTSKLRKVPEDRRDWLMLKINELFYNESQGKQNKSNFSEI